MKIFISILLLFYTVSGYAQTVTNDSLKQTADSGITREASFPGGEFAWRTFVAKMLQRNMDDFIRDGKSGVCRIRFVVMQDGSVANVEALTMKDSELAKRSIKAITKGPKWLPAMITADMLRLIEKSQ